MAATKTVSQVAQSHNSLTPRHGVVTLFGYGIQVQVERGHLIVEDGIGPERFRARFPRVGHGLKRLVVIGSDGMVSLAALRWLADQQASFILLERDGSVLLTTGPVKPSDAKLRRAQALAHTSDTALRISRELITQKLAGQERVARNNLLDDTTGDAIARFRHEVPSADSITTVRLLESQGAAAYWSAWRALPVNFPKSDLPRVPDHWRCFGARVNPINAILNYLYAVLESEARLAASAIGLDPGLGVLHVDTTNRDSLACDLMEPVRPQVDAYVLDWITRYPLQREWFFEEANGNARLMAALAIKLSETASTWRRSVAPFAEWVAREFWNTIRRPDSPLATRLSQTNKRKAKSTDVPRSTSAPRPENVCLGCGKVLPQDSTRCAKCAVEVSRTQMLETARRGRIASKSPESRARLTDTQRRQAIARYSWDPTTQPGWLTEDAYLKQILPLLRNISLSKIASSIGVSIMYASDIRRGRRRPHPRHWQALTALTGFRPMGH
jgi:CRISPR-associated endonuclease Cas1